MEVDMPWVLMVLFWIGLLASLWMIVTRRTRKPEEARSVVAPGSGAAVSAA
jgi:hypothetical protein